MLSMMLTTSCFGISRRMALSIRSHSARRFFDARAGVGAHMQLELAGVHRGKEILPQPRIQQGKRADGKNEEQDEKDRAVRDGELQQAEIEDTKLLKPALKSQLGANQRIAALVLLLLAVPGHAPEEGTWPWSEPRCGKGNKKPAWRRSRLRPKAQRDIWPRPP